MIWADRVAILIAIIILLIGGGPLVMTGKEYGILWLAVVAWGFLRVVDWTCTGRIRFGVRPRPHGP